MNEKWTDFEKFMFKFVTETVPVEFKNLNTRISRLEGRATVFGALGGLIAGAIIKLISHS